MTPEERKALDGYVAAVRAHYGERLHDILVFGSRARGDNKPDSDVDLAVIFTDEGWDYWRRKFDLIDMGWDAYIEQGLDIEPWPVSREKWEHHERNPNSAFVSRVRKDAKPVAEVS